MILAITLRYSSSVGVSSHAKLNACPKVGCPVLMISMTADETSFE